MPTQTELRQQITNQIIEALEKGGVPPWRMSWSSSPNGRGNPTNVASKRAYSGVNIWLLRLHAQKYGLRSRWFGSFQQWKTLGCSVKPRPAGVEPGAWGASVVLYKPLKKKEIDKKTGEEIEVEVPLLRIYSGLFAADQVNGAERWQVTDEPVKDDFIDFEPAEMALSAYPADVRYGGDRAYYSVNGDHIQMPHKGRFTEEKEYYGTLAHEMAHHSESRLGWKGDYALGELRAEIASAYMIAELGVPQSDDLSQVTAYVKSWLQSLRDDVSFIFKASSAASKAADHILSYSRPKEAAEEPAEVLVC